MNQQQKDREMRRIFLDTQVAIRKEFPGRSNQGLRKALFERGLKAAKNYDINSNIVWDFSFTYLLDTIGFSNRLLAKHKLEQIDKVFAQDLANYLS